MCIFIKLGKVVNHDERMKLNPIMLGRIDEYINNLVHMNEVSCFTYPTDGV